MGFKWQVPIGRKISIPFKREIYNIGLTQIILESKHLNPLDVVHIGTQPHDTKSVIWLNDTKSLNCIKSFVVQCKKLDDIETCVVEKQWVGRDIVYHKIDLSRQTLTFNIDIYNKNGDSINAIGYCVFDVRPNL